MIRKRCPSCKGEKELKEFHLCKISKDGRQPVCKLCRKEYHIKRYQKKREHILALNKVWRDNHLSLEKMSIYKNNSKKKYPNKYKAHTCVTNALSSGKLIRQPCEICGNPKSEAHHDSYEKSNWLKVTWLCNKHHKEKHHGTIQ